MNSLLLPLTVLDAYENTGEKLVGITPFLKSVFLLQDELNDVDSYTFRPGDYGPYCHNLYTDITRLSDRDFIKTTDVTKIGPFNVSHTVTQYELTDKGRRALDTARDEEMLPYALSDTRDIICDADTTTPYSFLKEISQRAPNMFTGTTLPFAHQ
ncbi:hypothetical protein [Salinibaculum rarum]|uniref:hypothetical protein n=1 Tax=Salinibaculum rarum TaxID=3058903 RepID=UPI00265D85BE|nr:hypothetical protein [Salinibaculum sp. KK48]